jgi:hypothetical protein
MDNPQYRLADGSDLVRQHISQFWPSKKLPSCVWSHFNDMLRGVVRHPSLDQCVFAANDYGIVVELTY